MQDIALKKLGDQIRSVRREKGMSQERLAALSGLHRTYIGGIERGERNIGFINLLRLSRALGTELSILVDGIDSEELPS